MNPFIRPRPVDHPNLRIFGFHHAGGSAASYYPMSRELPDDWDLMLLDLPGRGKRHAQRPLEDLRGVVAQAMTDLEPWLGGPVALFGHSFGALVAVEVGRALQAAGHTPAWVGVSGRVAPAHLPPRRLSDLDDEALMTAMVSMGGIPQRLNEVPEFAERFLRVARADIRASDTYLPDPDRTPLSCPITVFGGTDDAWAPLSRMSGWSAETTAGYRRRVFPGGHFYFLGDAIKGFTRELVGEIRAVPALIGS